MRYHAMQFGDLQMVLRRSARLIGLTLGMALSVVAATPAAQAEVQFQVYGGVNGNFKSDVSLHGLGPVDTRSVSWDGKSFEMPPYWGVRAIYWLDNMPGWGVGLEYTHAKAYAKLNGTAAGALYDKLEFTDGNNLVTANLLYRFSRWSAYNVRPYAGFGVGFTVPHVEVDLVGPGPRTFEYQLAGFASQGFVGLEMPFGRNWSGFAEAKFSYSHINGNLVGGGHIKTDLWSPHFAVGLAYRF